MDIGTLSHKIKVPTVPGYGYRDTVAQDKGTYQGMDIGTLSHKIKVPTRVWI